MIFIYLWIQAVQVVVRRVFRLRIFPLKDSGGRYERWHSWTYKWLMWLWKIRWIVWDLWREEPQIFTRQSTRPFPNLNILNDYSLRSLWILKLKYKKHPNIHKGLCTSFLCQGGRLEKSILKSCWGNRISKGVCLLLLFLIKELVERLSRPEGSQQDL